MKVLLLAAVAMFGQIDVDQKDGDFVLTSASEADHYHWVVDGESKSFERSFVLGKNHRVENVTLETRSVLDGMMVKGGPWKLCFCRADDDDEKEEQLADKKTATLVSKEATKPIGIGINDGRKLCLDSGAPVAAIIHKGKREQVESWINGVRNAGWAGPKFVVVDYDSSSDATQQYIDKTFPETGSSDITLVALTKYNNKVRKREPLRSLPSTVRLARWYDRQLNLPLVGRIRRTVRRAANRFVGGCSS